MKKELIKQRFSKSLNTYNKYAIVQKQMAEKLVSFLGNKNCNNVLELGCGTGFLTEILVNMLDYKSYTAIDIVDKCEDFINKIDNSINFVCSDIENVNLSGEYDLIISNAVFQWLDDFESFVNKLGANLSKDGVILFTTFGNKNFKELFEVSNLSLNYFTVEEMREKLCSYSVEVIEEDVIRLDFETIKQMLEHIKKTGVNALTEKTWAIRDINNFKKNYLSMFDSVHLTYNPIYVLLKKRV